MKKKIASLFLVLVFLVSGVSAFAMDLNETPIEIVPFRYQDISSILPGLSVSGTTATYSLTVIGSTNVTKLGAVLQIQKLNSDGTFSNYGLSWIASADSNYLYTYGTKSVDSGGVYRLKAIVIPYTSAGAGASVIVYS